MFADHLASFAAGAYSDPVMYKTMVFISIMVLADGLNASVSVRPYTKTKTRKFVATYIQENRAMCANGLFLCPEIVTMLLDVLSGSQEIFEILSV